MNKKNLDNNTIAPRKLFTRTTGSSQRVLTGEDDGERVEFDDIARRLRRSTPNTSYDLQLTCTDGIRVN